MIQPPLEAQQKASSDLIRGTIVVVVSTREGVVLAGDSRVTHQDGSHQDNYPKVFKVGNRTACVIAGVVGSEIGLAGFRMRDAIATRLRLLGDGTEETTAGHVAESFRAGFDGVVGLLQPGTSSVPGPAAALSVVTIAESGDPSWITFYLPVEGRTDSQGQMYITSGSPTNLYHSLEFGLRFDVQSLGYPTIARNLITAAGPSKDRYSLSKIMKKFYRRKAKGQLDQLTLNDAVELAKTLVEATIAMAPAEAGVGGPIDVLTVTRNGVSWIQRKTEIATLPEPFFIRMQNGILADSNQVLDGLECLRCTFRNMKLLYNGTADFELIGSKFEGTCQLLLGRGVRQAKPEVVRRLLDVLPTTCGVIDE